MKNSRGQRLPSSHVDNRAGPDEKAAIGRLAEQGDGSGVRERGLADRAQAETSAAGEDVQPIGADRSFGGQRMPADLRAGHADVAVSLWACSCLMGSGFYFYKAWSRPTSHQSDGARTPRG